MKKNAHSLFARAGKFEVFFGFGVGANAGFKNVRFQYKKRATKRWLKIFKRNAIQKSNAFLRFEKKRPAKASRFPGV